MKPKTIKEVIGKLHYSIFNGLSYNKADALAEIQQLLEECLPEPTTALDGNEAQIFIMATDQYKSNIRGKLK